MLEIIFGWRKASKCKRLIKRIQCRLMLLKNKRSWIVKQSRDDVAQLIKNGHDQTAFARVEQLFLDERIVEVYDLLNHFCEFIIIHLSYIRKHRDCPNDIGEAASTLIYASVRLGDLPELKEIRKLFEERYGHKFTAASLKLYPGNLVNCQIKENLTIQSVADDIKFSLFDEIWHSCLKTGPLTIEYHPQLQEKQAIQRLEDELDTSDTQSKYITNYLCYSPPNQFDLLAKSRKQSSMEKSRYLKSPYKYKSVEKKTDDIGVKSSSESSLQLSKEFVYLDDIEEYRSPRSGQVNAQDTRLFMFKSPLINSTNTVNNCFDESYIKKCLSMSTKVKDFESAIYYGHEDKKFSKYQQQRKRNQKKSPIKENKRPCFSNLDHTFRAKTGENDPKIRAAVHDCGLGQACHFYTSDKDISESLFSIELNESGKEEGLGVPTSSPSIEKKTKAKSKSLYCPHVHPKLPDYDELAATFTALKKANMQIKSR